MVNLNKQIHAQFDKMCKTGKLFRVELSGQQVWDLYLKSFENDPVFRDPSSSEHACNTCNNFIRRYGNIVAVDMSSGKLMTLFDVDGYDEYVPVVKALSKKIKKSKIVDVFFETFQSLTSLP